MHQQLSMASARAAQMMIGLLAALNLIYNHVIIHTGICQNTLLKRWQMKLTAPCPGESRGDGELLAQRVFHAWDDMTRNACGNDTGHHSRLPMLFDNVGV